MDCELCPYKARMENNIARLQDELNLEKTWQEGEIDWWRQQVRELEEEIRQLKKSDRKPWWRYVFS